MTDGRSLIQGMTPLPVSLDGPTGPLAAYLYLPAGKNPPVGCVINCHGSGTVPNGHDISRPQTAELITGWGYAFLFFHRAGYGNSPGTWLWDDVTVPRGEKGHGPLLSARLTAEAADVDATIGWAANDPRIYSGRIAIMGNSLGGIHALLATERNPHITCGINFAGGVNQWQHHPEIRTLMLDAVARITKPIFIAQAENDSNTGPTEELGAALKDRGAPHEARIYPSWGATPMEAHLFETNGGAIWGPDVRRFIDGAFRG